jgi:hypothetical protein
MAARPSLRAASYRAPALIRSRPPAAWQLLAKSKNLRAGGVGHDGQGLAVAERLQKLFIFLKKITRPLAKYLLHYANV